MVKKLTKFERGLVKNWQDLTRIGQKLTKFDKIWQKLSEIDQIDKNHQNLTRNVMNSQDYCQIWSFWSNLEQICQFLTNSVSNLVHPILINLVQFLIVSLSALPFLWTFEICNPSNLVNFWPFVILWTRTRVKLEISLIFLMNLFSQNSQTLHPQIWPCSCNPLKKFGRLNSKKELFWIDSLQEEDSKN